jgi:hypothetical protein
MLLPFILINLSYQSKFFRNSTDTLCSLFVYAFQALHVRHLNAHRADKVSRVFVTNAQISQSRNQSEEVRGIFLFREGFTDGADYLDASLQVFFIIE